jgi:hypothetical protein
MSQEIDSRKLRGDLSIASTLSALGWLRTDDLPFVAADALANGADSPALRELAGTSASDATEVGRDLLTSVMSELALQPASPCAARLAVASQIAEGILDGTVTERAGTRRIYFALGDWGDEDCDTVKARWLEFDDGFDRLTYDIPAHRPDLAELQRAVRAAAADLLA